MKKIMVLFSAFIFAVIGMVNVKAIHVVENSGDLTSGIGYSGSNVTVTKDNDGVYTLTLSGEAKQDLEIRSGEKVILELGSYNFLNYSSGCSAIWIQDGGSLTIKGTGTVKLQSSSNENGPSAINNAGTLVIEGGNFSAEKKGTAAIYNSGTLTFGGGTVKSNVDGSWGITNVGTATINGGTFENVNGNDTTSVVENNGSLTINNGTFKSNNPGAAAIHNSANKTLIFNNGNVETDVAGAWGLNNDGTATIKNGTFTQNHDWSVILNSGNMTIANGIFKTSNSTSHNSLITTVSSGTTNVDGGQFTVQEGDPIFYSGDGAGKTNVDGGTFIGSYLDPSLLEEGYAVDSNGNVYKLADYSSLNAALATAKEIDTSKYTAESVKDLLDAIAAAEAVESGLSIANQSKVDALTNAIITAIENLVEKDELVVKPSEKSPNTFDAGLVYMGLALSAVGASVVSIKKLRNN